MFGLKEYFDKFVDKNLNNRWGLVASENNQINIRLPNGVPVVGAPGAWDWERAFPRDDATSRLWYQSLLWLPFVSSDLDREDLVVNVLEEYTSWLKGRALAPEYRPFNSQDHAHAVQIQAACAIIARASLDGKKNNISEVKAAAVRFLQELEPVVFQEKYMLPNNHGLMLSRSFLEAGFVLEKVGVSNNLAEKYKEKGRSGIAFVIENVFDDEGMVNENTPAYQGLYIEIIAAILRFQKYVDGSNPAIREWENLLETATSKLQLMLWNDGRFPPLGDDTGEMAKISPKTGTLFSQENGSYFYSDEKTELSIVCGYRGIVHKHADDTSFRLRFKGKDLIMDAGLLSYDLQDPIAVSLFSQRGHSGLFYQRFDNLRGQELYFARPPRVVSEIEKSMLDNGQTVISCRSIIDGKWAVERKYSQSDCKLFIDDRYECPEGEEPPIQRFLIHEDALLSSKGSVVSVQNGNAFLEITTDPSASIRITAGDFGEIIHGWRAAERYQPAPCHVIEIEFPRGEKNLQTSLAWSEAKNSEYSNVFSDEIKLEKLVSTEFEGKNFLFPEGMSTQGFVSSASRLTPKHRISLSSASDLLKEMNRLNSDSGSWVLDISEDQTANGFLLAEKSRDTILMCRSEEEESNLASLLRLNEGRNSAPQPLLLVSDESEVRQFGWLDDSRPGLVILERDVLEVSKLASTFLSFASRPIILFLGSLRDQVQLMATLGSEGGYVPYLSYSDGGLILLPNVDSWDYAVQAVLVARRSANSEIAIRDLRYRNSLVQDQISKLTAPEKGEGN